MFPWLNWIEFLITNQKVADSNSAGNAILENVSELGIETKYFEFITP
jgi:hypothetical protein